ncbi:MAG: FHA domain-containing protein [Deltaproteobacteria bacterium]|nr:FHA domain-containing protein [Deltaproteobacteria bacterium]
MSTLHAWLEFTDIQTGSPRRVDLDTTSLTIGRTGGDLRLTDPELSDIHAILTRERGAFIIRDLGSVSGTQVNGRPVVEAQLTNLDELKLGGTKLIFHAAYLTPEAYARRFGHAQAAAAAADKLAPGRTSDGVSSRKLLIPFQMFTHPLRFWPQALETGVLQLRRTWLIHLMALAAVVASALLNGASIPLLHLGILTLAASIAFILAAITCSVFFAFDSLNDAPHRLSQALRFTFCLTPFLLVIQILFLTWAARVHPRSGHYFMAAGVPTLGFCALVGIQSHYAFAASVGRGLAFALTASVPWNLLMTGLMSFMV